MDMHTALILRKEKTIIMIAHRLKTVRHADQIFVIDNGKIVQYGTHQELMDLQGRYYRLVMAQREMNRMAGAEEATPEGE